MMGFNNIIGHEEIIRHLKNAIETGKVSHSYIFTGEPGSGKKLLAGTFAATLQCEAGGTEPCQKCDSCKKAVGKSHPWKKSWNCHDCRGIYCMAEGNR